MATLGDVEAAISQALASFIFPGQNYQQTAVANCTARATEAPGAPSIIIPLRLGIGIPETDAIEADLEAGISNVCVSKFRGFSRNTTRFAPQRHQTSANVPTLTAALYNGTVTFGGTCTANQIVSVRAGAAAQNATCYAYLTTGTDTPVSVAAAFAAQIPAATSAGAVLTAANIVSAQVAVWQSGVFVTGQTETLIQVTILATPVAGVDGYAVRSAIGSRISHLHRMQRPDGSFTQFLGLPDGTHARVRLFDEFDDDTPRRDNLWRRWTDYRVEFDESSTEHWPVVLAPLIVANTNGAHILWFGPGAPAADLLTDGAGNLLTDSSGATLGMLT